MAQVFQDFDQNIDNMLLQWKKRLENLLSDHKVPSEVANTMVSGLSIHMSLIYVDDLRLTAGSGRSEKGDFKSPLYSLIKGIEKFSTHTAVAVYYNQISDITPNEELIFESKTGKAEDFIQLMIDHGSEDTLSFDPESTKLKMGLIHRKITEIEKIA